MFITKFFKTFLKKNLNKNVLKKRWPLKLPEVPKDQQNVADIARYLHAGKPIWAWYSLSDKPDFYVTRFLTGNRMDGFAMWRVEGDYLCMYIAYFDADMVVYLKLAEIRKATNSNILAVIESDMTYAYKIMYDDMHYTADTMLYVHDVTPEMIAKELQDKSTWIVGEEHFICKDNHEGLARDIKTKENEEKSCD